MLVRMCFDWRLIVRNRIVAAVYLNAEHEVFVQRENSYMHDGYIVRNEHEIVIFIVKLFGQSYARTPYFTLFSIK